MFKYKKALLFLNRAVYLMSAAMLMAGLALSASPELARATAIDVCGNIPGNQDSFPTGMVSDGSGNCVCQPGYTLDANGKSCTAPTPPDDQVCPHDGDWVKIDGLSSNSYTYAIPAGKEVVEVCYKAGNNTFTFSVIPPATGSITISNDQFANDNGQYHDLSHATFRVQDIPVEVSVCHVPDDVETDYITETMTETEWDLHNDTDTNDRLMVPGANPCTPPINYIPVCDVPTTIDGSYTTINVAEGELAAWLAAHTEDFSLAAGGTCGPTTIDVCLVPEYTTTSVDQLFLTEFLAAHQGSFVPSIDKPCEEPTVLVCHVPAYQTESMTISAWLAWFIDHQLDYLVENNGQCKPPEQKIWVCHVPEGNPASAHAIHVSINAWDDDSGTGHKGHVLDFEVTGPDDPACPPPTVQYCHYSTSAYLWTQETGYSWQITAPDYILNAGESCPVKLEYCRYDTSSDTYTNVQLYLADVSANDSALEQGEICPSKIEPSAQCVWANGDGSVDAVFAYNNPNAGTISIPIGTENDLSGSGAFLGGPQPTDFLTGANSDAFIVTFLDMKTVSWFIKSPDFANGITATAAATGPACQDDPKKELNPVVLLDPYCYSMPGTLMQWTVENPNGVPFSVNSWSIDGVPQSGGFVAPVGESLLTTTALGSHTVDLYWGLTGHAALRYTIDSCTPDIKDPTPGPTPTEKPKTKVTPQVVAPLPIPVTGQGGEIIPVTGADQTPFGNIWVFAGFGMFGFGMVLSGLRKRLGL